MLTLPSGTLHFGCALEMMRALPPECVDMVFTDPPYRVISGGMESAKSRGQFKIFGDTNQGKIFKHNDCAAADYMPELFRLLKPGTHCYVMTNNINLRELLNVGDAVGFHFHNLLRWDKSNVTANRWYMKDCEYIVFFAKKPAKTINNPGSKQGFTVRNIPSAQRLHPTEKPVELVRHYIENSSQPGDLVLDPFAGSGSTAAAAIACKRRWLSAEMDADYYLKTVERLCNQRLP